MKPFIYLSVLLITAGSAFGLADYLKDKKNGTLDKLYKDDEEVPAAVTKAPVATKTAPVTVVGVTTAVTASDVKTPETKKIKKKVPRKMSLDLFTRGDERTFYRPPAVVEEPLKPMEADKPVPVKEEAPRLKEAETPKPATDNPVTATVIKEERAPSLTSLFSRGKPPKRVKTITVKSE